MAYEHLSCPRRLNDASGAMCRGITCTLHPARPGAKATDHASTSFRHVPLPAGALLRHLHRSPKNERKDFMHATHRVTVVTLCLSKVMLPSCACQTALPVGISTKRRVGGSTSVPILSFSTRYGPIVRVLAHAAVFDEYAIEAIQSFIANVIKLDVQNVIAGVFKATVIDYTQKAHSIQGSSNLTSTSSK
ncbi:hypothetical protein F4861DRAFT_139473 [Xylaria intraflava]|nr:hypothetical protein F4861DRAFT_139473 [Xylaria intraflava]